MIKTLKEIIVMDNGFVKVHNDKVEFPDKNHGFYYKVSLSEKFPNYCVCGLVITENNNIVLMDNFRYAHSDYATETVKGLGMVNKTPFETFNIEMLEEIGYRSNDVQEVLRLRGDSHDYFIHCFIARNSMNVSDTFHESTEVIKNIKEVSLRDAQDMIKNGLITDPLTITLIQYAIIEFL